MPTAYTQPLYDDQPITFEQFVLRCAHGMGAAIMQRDEPLDTPLRPRTVPASYVEDVEKAVTALAEAFELTDEQWDALQAQSIDEARRHRDAYVARKTAVRRRYYEMREQVRNWQPPTEEHEGLKGFMLDQLRTSIDFDGGNYEPSVPETVPASEYREREIGRLSNELERCTKYLQEERQRARDQNAWLDALHASLNTPLPSPEMSEES